MRAAYPHLSHVAGFSGRVSLGAIDHGCVRVSCRIGERTVAFRAPLRSVPLPPDHLQQRQVGSVWGEAFFTAGRTMFDQLVAAFAEAGQPLDRSARVLDFGCGCGRVLWMFRQLPHAGEIWGCDVDPEAIEWNLKNLGDVGRFRCNSAMPPAPFSDGFFDAIYSVSVFTHLPERVQFAWLAELRRLLRPGGVAVVSVHGERYWSADTEVRTEVEARGFAYRTGVPTEGLPGYYMVAFHSEAYVRREWAQLFEVVDVKRQYLYGAHDAILLRRPLSEGLARIFHTRDATERWGLVFSAGERGGGVFTAARGGKAQLNGAG